MIKIDKNKMISIMPLALGIAMLPPLWAVVSPYLGITTGAVALICAALYVVNGNKLQDGIKISLGFLCGDIWSYSALKFMSLFTYNPNVVLYSTLFILGGLAVIISCLYNRWIYLPAWLCGWAIGLTIMGPIGINHLGSLPIQIGISMLVGVWYVGAGVDKFQAIVIKIINNK